MKSKTLIFLVSLLMLGTSDAWAEGGGNKLWLEGNSTAHDYSSRATEINILADFKKGNQGLASSRLKKLEVTIPVTGLKSDKKALDKKMYKALKADSFPVIRFNLSEYKVHSLPDKRSVKVEAQGSLTVAGSTISIDLEPKVFVEDKVLHVKGSQELLMTDFGIEPPTALLGTLKTEDRIVIHYEIQLKPK